MKRAGQSTAARLQACSTELIRRGAIVCLAILLWGTPGKSLLIECNRTTDVEQIAAAIERISHSVDPCGESAQVAEILETLEHCSKTTYQICTNSEITRNLFDRPVNAHGDRLARVINWNPYLRSELEPGCDSDSTKAVLRDPTASLLHELVHAAYDCRGINPGEHEIEAVRIENIYRRAAGLCQRTAYGDEPLPRQLVKECTPERCRCSSPDDPTKVVQPRLPPFKQDLRPHTSTETRAGDNAASGHNVAEE